MYAIPRALTLSLLLCGLVSCSLVLAACGGGDEGSAGPAGRLPHVLAPVDTAGGRGADTISLGGAGRIPEEDSLAARWQAPSPDPRWPSADRLAYTRYRNDAFGFSIAYPDTILKPRADVGQGRGREFASADGQVVALVYVVEGAGPQMLDDQYQGYLGDPGVRVTYRLRETDWYVVSGYRGARKFYDKTVLRGGALKTFQIQYDTTRAAYFDAVAATMATSFEG